MIEIKNLTKSFRTPRGKITVLDGVSLSVGDGSFLGVAGKSGAGKSTLLSLLAGLQKPDSGSIAIGGRNILDLSDKQFAAFRNRNIGFISQEQSFLETLTVLDNVRLPAYLGRGRHSGLEAGSGRAGHSSGETSVRAMELLAGLGIAHLAGQYPQELSGGENHRVLIARALMNDPGLILADEPTDSVDREQTLAILEIFARLATEGKTVIFVSHDEGALSSCDAVYRIGE